MGREEEEVGLTEGKDPAFGAYLQEEEWKEESILAIFPTTIWIADPYKHLLSASCMPALCWKLQKGALSIILETISSLGAETCLAHCREQKSREDLGGHWLFCKEEAVSSNALILGEVSDGARHTNQILWCPACATLWFEPQELGSY